MTGLEEWLPSQHDRDTEFGLQALLALMVRHESKAPVYRTL